MKHMMIYLIIGLFCSPPLYAATAIQDNAKFEQAWR